MSYQQSIFHLISSIIGQNNNIVIPVEIIKFTGDYHTAALLSQLIYWQGKQRDPEDWIYKTYDQWHAELMLSKYQTSRAAKALVKMGILETKVARVKLDNGMYGDKAVHYRIKQEEFAEKFTEHLSVLESKETSLSKIEELNLSKSSNSTNLHINTETTSKNTTTTEPPPETGKQDISDLPLPPSSFSEKQLAPILAGLMSLVPEAFQTSSVEHVIKAALTAHSDGYIKSAILYTTDHSTGQTTAKFKAYLGRCIEGGWAYGYRSEAAENLSTVKKSFEGMPEDVLRLMAGAGNSFAMDELERRKTLRKNEI